MKEKYEVIKKLYPNYLILFKVKDKYKSINIDKDIIDYFKLKNLKYVNKIILNNLDVEVREDYDNNLYNIYYIKIKLIKYLKGLYYEKENNI